MDPNNKYRAEDLLSNHIPKDEENMISDSEQELAQNIKSVLKATGGEKLSPLETAELWTKIKSSTAPVARTFGWKRYIQIAAVVIMVLGAGGTWQYQRNTSTNKLLNFAAQNINKKSAAPKQSGIKTGNASAIVPNEEENIITTNDFNTLVVGDGQRSAIKLPDGTKVWLNSGSKLIYPISFNKNSREVYLEGEAYFDVIHNKEQPFYVRSKNMNIKVLGTEFYVSSDEEHKTNYAVLVQGSIAFSTGSWLNKTERTLVPGDRISLDPEENKLLISQVKTNEFQAWKDGYVDINSESLDVIVQKVAKYYNIEISTDGLNLSAEKFTGRLGFQRSASDVLDNLCYGTPYVYDNTERRLVTRSN